MLGELPTPIAIEAPVLWPCGLKKPEGGPRKAEEGLAWREKGSSVYGYGNVTTEERGSVLDVRTDARRRSVDGLGASGVEGAGSVKVKLCTVEAGWSVEAMISTSRVKESCR